MWAKDIFFKAFFFSSWAISGQAFFGGIIYLAALDFGPAALNLQTALMFMFVRYIMRLPVYSNNTFIAIQLYPPSPFTPPPPPAGAENATYTPRPIILHGT
jgi:hypothetical protein